MIKNVPVTAVRF